MRIQWLGLLAFWLINLKTIRTQANCNEEGNVEVKKITGKRSTNGKLDIDLTVQVCKIEIGSLNLIRRTWNGEVPSPTWWVKKGDVINLKLTNKLEEPNPKGEYNGFRLPNTTNIHTHGLHISSNDPSDNVLRKVDPGEDASYTFEIEPDHPSGLFWFHPHFHGSTLLQVHSGMAGMIIVEDDANINPTLKSVTCPFNCQHDIQLIFQPLLYFSGTYNFTQIQDNHNDTLARSPTCKDNIFTTNGQIRPTLTIEAGQLKRLRLLNGGGGPVLVVGLVTATNSPSCEVREIAVDGIYLDKPRQQKKHKSVLAPATRMEWLVRCSTAGTYYIKSFEFNEDFVGNIDQFEGILLKISVTGSNLNTNIDWDESLPPRPNYMQNFLDVNQNEVDRFFVVEITQGLALNREYFDEKKKNKFKIECDKLQEWYIINTSAKDNHPIHIHVNHFQIVGFEPYNGYYSVYKNEGSPHFKYYDKDSKSCFYQHEKYKSDENIPSVDLSKREKFYGHEQRWDNPEYISYPTKGEFRDTVLLPPLSKLKIRFMPHKFMVTVMIHCHLLDHEDKGMMMMIDVVPIGEKLDKTFAASGKTGDKFNYPGTCAESDIFPFNSSPTKHNFSNLIILVLLPIYFMFG